MAEYSIQPFYDLLTLDDEDKHIELFDSGHSVPYDDRERLTREWFDKHLGDPRRSTIP